MVSCLSYITRMITLMTTVCVVDSGAVWSGECVITDGVRVG
jgi:hypothetical protein